MEILFFVIGMAIILAMTIGPLVMVVYKKRVIAKPYDKSIVYLATEMAYASEKWHAVKEYIDYDNPKTIPVPFVATWRGMIGQPFTSFGNIGSIWYGLTFLVMLIMVAISKSDLKIYAPDFLNFSLIIVLGMCWFVYYFRSFSADITESSLKSDLALGHLIDLGWSNIDKDVIETIKDEVKLDFDLFKKEGGIAGFLLVFIASSLLFYSRISELLSPVSISIILFLFGSVFISKWLYEGYRTRIIYISLNAVMGLIKNGQIENANKRVN